MRRGWTIFNRILMWLSIGAGIYVVYILTNLIQEYTVFEGASRVVAVGGILIVFIFHAFWGMIIDISSNIADLPTKKDFDNLSHLLAHKINEPEQIIKVNPVNLSHDERIEETIDDELSEINKNNFLPWICATCGNSNSGRCAFCQNCGKPRIDQTVDNTDNSINSEVQS